MLQHVRINITRLTSHELYCLFKSDHVQDLVSLPLPGTLPIGRTHPPATCLKPSSGVCEAARPISGCVNNLFASLPEIPFGALLHRLISSRSQELPSLQVKYKPSS
jgi:hypothetical protein